MNRFVPMDIAMLVGTTRKETVHENVGTTPIRLDENMPATKIPTQIIANDILILRTESKNAVDRYVAPHPLDVSC